MRYPDGHIMKGNWVNGQLQDGNQTELAADQKRQINEEAKHSLRESDHSPVRSSRKFGEF